MLYNYSTQEFKETIKTPNYYDSHPHDEWKETFGYNCVKFSIIFTSGECEGINAFIIQEVPAH